ncbi:tyrosine-type recombinase/integrase [Burkholderia sp. KBS0801]|uniref:tyrosine-type recombinase/integrase n=1 Tax=Burkholderia sp. KBS0801 TaxID=1179675 RepID=UPI00110F18F3|nr:site-specific integrase [Burkholderia sp. KBS0801]QDW51048.1 site-specific integrase [Burkholderia sp. KBS0801]
MREGQAKVLSDSEFRRVVNLVKKEAHATRNVAVLYCSFGLGLRAKEMASLRIRHVLDDGGKLLDEIDLDGSMTKGKKQRHAYLTNPKVADAIRDYLDERRSVEGILFNYDAPLFRSQKDGQFTPNTLQQLFQRMYSKARLQGASSHSGRRTFATVLIEKGVDIKAVSTLMGHASIAMTARYVEDNPVRLKQISADIM